MIARAYPVADRGRALGLWAAASTLTTAPGPVLGGMFITWGGDPGWRLPRHLPLIVEFWSLVVPLAALAGTGLGLDVASLTAAEMQGAADGEQGAASGINTAVARAAGLAAVAVLGRVAAWSHGDAAPGFGVPGDGPAHLAATGTAFGTIALIASLSAALAAALALCVTRAVR